MAASSVSGRLAVLGLTAAALWAPAAQARVYPVPIVVDNEDDLRLLIQDGVLDPDDFDTLLELLSNPVDLNRASKNQIYDLPGLSLAQSDAIVKDRRKNGPFSSVGDLERVPGVGPASVEQVRQFAVADPRPEGPKLDDLRTTLKGRASYHLEDRSVYGADPGSSNRVEDLGYGELPQGYLSARVKHPWGFDGGFIGLAHEGVARTAYSPADRAIYADWGRPALELGRAWASVERGRYSAIAGHYTAGFGLGITFDRTQRTRPQGWYPDMSVNTDIEDGDFRLPQTLVGVAGRVEDVPLGDAMLEATVFLSSRTPDVYQYHMAVTGGDPFDPDSDELVSPRVIIDGYEMAYVTVPNLWRENLAGANAEVSVLGRARFGVTGWGGVADRAAMEGVPDNQELYIRQRVSDTDQYGAYGAYAGYGDGPFDVTAEYGRTFSGGNGLLLMGLYDQGPAEVELSLRHYGTTYDNPHARGIAAADVYRGFRDRDEQGARLRTELRPSKVFSTRWMVDAWRNIESGRSNLEVFGRAQVQPQRWLMLAVLGDHRNRDLANNGRTRIYGGDYDDELAELDGVTLDTSDVDVIEGAGSRNYVAGQVKFSKIPMTTLEVFHRRTYEDAGLVYPRGGEVCEPGFMIGSATWFKARVKPVDKTTLTLRWRVLDENIHGSQGDHFTDGYVQVEQKFNATWKATVRGGLLFDLPDPEAEWDDACDNVGRPDLGAACAVGVEDTLDPTAARDKPEALILATLEAKFR